ncbi:MAG: hypothetical protein RL756_279 [Pseudomonadota bacterium]|jgi:hypothetical protein
MLRMLIDDSLKEAWEPAVARHYQMTLASCVGDLRTLTLRLERDGDNFVHCTLDGRFGNGERLRVEGRHADGESAISHVMARARRALRRRQTYGQSA